MFNTMFPQLQRSAMTNHSTQDYKIRIAYGCIRLVAANRSCGDHRQDADQVIDDSIHLHGFSFDCRNGTGLGQTFGLFSIAGLSLPASRRVQGFFLNAQSTSVRFLLEDGDFVFARLISV